MRWPLLVIAIAGCAGAPPPAAPAAPHVVRRSELIERSWQPARLPTLSSRSRPYSTSPLIVIPHLGPTLGPAPKEDIATLEHAASVARGRAKLVALDRLADGIEDHVTDDENTFERELGHVAATYRALFSAPGFASYATDALLFRAARALFDADAATDAHAVLDQLIAKWPKSPLVPDAYVMLAKDAGRNSPDAERAYLDLAMAAGPRPTLVAYIRLEHADALVSSSRYDEAFVELHQVAIAEPDWRDLVGAIGERAFLQSGTPGEARATFDKLDGEHVDQLVARLADDYIDDGRDADALVVLDDLIARATSATDACYPRGRSLYIKRRTAPREELLADGRAYIDVAATADAACRTDADDQLGQLAWAWQLEQAKSEGDLRQVERAWELVLEVATTDERRAVALRDRAYVAWEIAQGERRFDARAWRVAAAAFEAAYTADPSDPDLHEAADDARHNAAVIERR